jgi:hypothetical protein
MTGLTSKATRSSQCSRMLTQLPLVTGLIREALSAAGLDVGS